MTYIMMACIVMACIVMAYVVMAYIADVTGKAVARSSAISQRYSRCCAGNTVACKAKTHVYAACPQTCA